MDIPGFSRLTTRKGLDIKMGNGIVLGSCSQTSPHPAVGLFLCLKTGTITLPSKDPPLKSPLNASSSWGLARKKHLEQEREQTRKNP